MDDSVRGFDSDRPLVGRRRPNSDDMPAPRDGAGATPAREGRAGPVDGRSPDHLLNLGDLHMSAENYGDALRCYVEAVNRFAGTGAGADLVEAQLRVVSCHVARGELPEAEAVLSEIPGDVATISPPPSAGCAEILCARIDAVRGILDTKLGRYDDAVERCRRAIARLREREDAESLRVQAETYLFLGQSLERRGDTPRAGASFENALRLYERIGDRRGISHAFNNLGLNRKQQQRFREAIALLRRALDVLDDVGEYPGRARICLNLGIVYLRLGDWQEAKPLLDRAVQISREIDNRWTQCKALVALGQLHMRRREVSAAKRRLVEAGEIAARGHYRRECVLVKEFEAERLTSVGRADEALTILDAAWDEAMAFAAESDLCVEILRRRAEALYVLRRFDDAVAAAHRCVDLARTLGDQTEQASAERVLVLIDFQRGDRDAAREALERICGTFATHGVHYEVAHSHVLALMAIADSGDVPERTLGNLVELAATAREILERTEVSGHLAELELTLAECARVAGDRELADRHLKAAGPHVEVADDNRLLERQLSIRGRLDADAQSADVRFSGAITSRELHRVCRGDSLVESMGGLLDLVMRKTNSDRAMLLKGERPADMTVVADIGFENVEDRVIDALGPLIAESVSDGLPCARGRDSLPDRGSLRAAEAIALVPLCLPDEVWGVVVLGRSRSHVLGAYRPSDLRLFHLLGELATVSVLSIERAELLRERDRQRNSQTVDGLTNPIVYRGKKMEEILRTVKKVADSPARVLLVGETGSGKGILAQAIHDLGSRAGKPFVHVNCASLPEQLLESELFGHVSGAFTGANRTKLGLFEEADGGTIFLDEIDKTSVAVQGKLLHVLDHREIRPVGANQWRTVDARIVSATNAELPALIGQGSFLQDLYYRLNDISIAIPALRDRSEDVEPLAQYFAQRVIGEMGRSGVELSREFIARLVAYPWPGNVRELEKVVRRAVVLAEDDERVGIDHLPPELLGTVSASIGQRSTLKAAVQSLERQLISDTLESASGNKSEVARRLGISYPTLLAKVRAFDL